MNKNGSILGTITWRKKDQQIRAWVNPPPFRTMPERKRSFSTDVFPNLNMTVVAKKSRCWTGPRPVIKFGKEKYFVVVAISVGRQKSVRTTALSVVSQRYE